MGVDYYDINLRSVIPQIPNDTFFGCEDNCKAVVNFYPVSVKGTNYLKNCYPNIDRSTTADPRCVIKKYTEDITWFCSRVNFALATDSPALYEMGEYVRDLQYCIYSLGKITDGVAQFYICISQF